MSDGTRRSAFERLSALPAVFDVREAERILGIPRDRLPVYAHRWKASGLVSPLGERNVGVWFNLVADREGPVTRRREAVDKALNRPSVAVGGAALHAAGWTTQRHSRIALAVPVGRAVRTLPKFGHGIELLPRSMRWFRTLNANVLPDPEVEGFVTATPEMALADALLADRRGLGAASGHVPSWSPVLDEIDPFEDDAWQKVRAALTELRADPAEIEELLEGMGEEPGFRR